MNLSRYFIIFFLLLFIFINCTITIKPRINVNVIDATDNLERQILGEFKIIQDKMLYFEEGKKNNISQINQEELKFYTAMKNRIFFQDKIIQFLQKKYIGEGENGKVVILYNDKNGLLYDNIKNIVNIENKARNDIISYISKKEHIKNTDEYWKTFHKIQVENLNKGMLYEEGGKWIEKK